MATKNRNKRQSNSNRTEEKKNPLKRQKLHKAYYSAANVLWQLNEKSGSLNSLMNRFTGDKCIKMIYALAVKVLKNHNIIEQIQSKLPDFDSNVMNSFLIEILIAELLFGEKSFLKYRRKDEVKYVIENRQKIIEQYAKVKNIENETSNDPWIRYIRINYLKNSKTELMKKLEQLEFKQRLYSKHDIQFDQFKTIALSLAIDEYLIDYHFEDVFVFNDESTKKLTPLYEDGSIAMQDKSSLLAIEAMNLEENMIIMDACAAPGMKTSAIASRLNNSCTIYANDKDKKRFNDMKILLKRNGVRFKSSTEDFTQIDPTKYSNLDCLLLDPSCSGSGINRRLEYTHQNHGDQSTEENLNIKKRCENLAKFQLAILQSAIAFQAKRIVYCTCSKYQIENEDVIEKLFEMNLDLKNQYEIIDPMPEWPLRGQGNYSFSLKCLRADYETTMTNGFFCCVLQRLQQQQQQPSNSDQSNDDDNKAENIDNHHDDDDDDEMESKKPKKKKLKKRKINGK
ncbi:putative 28S rRNA (cytosine-C(5))-methyltransferase [Dermatophagoides pteronyssinus]|uniref:28S rRNA (Cytosine-C(5))-methyltransferase n=1 Tax=Dermatophagoides pteronyssinus TaxID=6956 RepID=A0ABQ8J447_DERPT|nr:putative 28S rRNA (cytosine-C(5))-methyltransferase [Dermatophagoides pteronyssinus]